MCEKTSIMRRRSSLARNTNRPQGIAGRGFPLVCSTFREVALKHVFLGRQLRKKGIAQAWTSVFVEEGAP